MWGALLRRATRLSGPRAKPPAKAGYVRTGQNRCDQAPVFTSKFAGALKIEASRPAPAESTKVEFRRTIFVFAFFRAARSLTRPHGNAPRLQIQRECSEISPRHEGGEAPLAFSSRVK
jgi:hypothetical protein